jgi:hypothetical protein
MSDALRTKPRDGFRRAGDRIGALVEHSIHVEE